MMFLTSTRRCAARALTSKASSLAAKRHADVAHLPEVVAATTLRDQIAIDALPRKRSAPTLDAAQTRTLVDAGLQRG